MDRASYNGVTDRTIKAEPYADEDPGPVIFDDGNVRISRHLAAFGSQSYVIDKINSVEVREEKKKSSRAWVWFTVIAIIIGFAVVIDAILSERTSLGLWIFFLGAVFIAVVLYDLRPKPVYHLVLETSSGEVQATSTGDRDAIVELRQAIETAKANQV